MSQAQEKFKDKGFTVLAFPCNQFGLQENSSNEEILPTLKFVRPGDNYEPNFPMFRKILVNGDGAHEAFKFLKEKLPDTPSPPQSNWVDDLRPSFLHVTPCKGTDIRWNFEKFLVDRDGKPIKRYIPSVQLDDIMREIEEFLKEEEKQPQSKKLRSSETSALEGKVL